MTSPRACSLDRTWSERCVDVYVTPRDDADALLNQWNGAGRRAYRPRVDFRVLGPVAAFVDGKPVGLGGPKQRTVLALLLLDAGRAVPADVLIDGVWGDGADAGGEEHAAELRVQPAVGGWRSARNRARRLPPGRRP